MKIIKNIRVLFLLLLISCTSNNNNPDNEISVAAILNTSGRMSFIGDPTYEALEVYQEVFNELNNAVKISIKLYDVGSDNNNASIISDEVLKDNPQIILSSTSGTSLAVMPFLKDKSNLVIANAGHPGIIGTQYPNTLLAFPAPIDECSSIKRILKNETAFLVRSNDVYHDLDSVELQKLLGQDLIGEEVYNVANPNFTSIVRRIENTRPDNIVLMGFGVTYVQFFNELLERNINIPIIVDTDFLSNSHTDYPSEILDSVRFIGTKSTLQPELEGYDETDIISEYKARFFLKYNETPKYYAVILIDALHAVLMNSDPSLMNYEDIISKIEELNQQELGAGLTSFDNRRIRVELSEFGFKNGEPTRLNN